MKEIKKHGESGGKAGAIAAGFLFLMAGCAKLDVVGQDSINSFQALLSRAPREVTVDEMTGGWVLSAPDGSAQFIWSRNYAESPLHDVMIVFEARPFLNAGLDPSRLPESITVFDDFIMVGTKLGQETLTYSGEPTPLASFEHLVKLKREALGYHMAMDHYGVNLSGGNLFEWAKDLGTNDKDMVFVLDPAPFLAGGVDPNAVEGWVFAKVPVDDENGRPVEVDKLLKPFDLP
jgi:hypothetical protein